MRDGRRSGLHWRVLLALVSVLAGPPALAQPNNDSRLEIVVHALGLVDVPYRYGGRTPAGFDCSGFVGYVFDQTAKLVLPRRAEDIRRLGDELDKGELVPGDLVFFNTLGRRFSHVGIYVGDGQFVHAPARRGRVRLDRLGDPYWTARYNGARRLGGGRGEPAVAAAVSMPAAGSAAEAIIDVRITP